MKIKFIIATLAIIILSGCYSPPPNGELITELEYSDKFRNAVDYNLIVNKKELSLKEAIDIALNNNPEYISTFYAIENAKRLYYQAIGAYFFTIDTHVALGQQIYDSEDSTILDSSSSDNSFYLTTGVQATWLIFDGLAREFAYLASQNNIEREKKLNENAKRILIKAVSLAYLEIINSQNQYNIAQTNFEFQSEQFEFAKIKNRIGEISRSDLLSFNTQKYHANNRLLQAKKNLEIAKNALATLMGYATNSLPNELILTIPDNEICKLMELNYYINEALHNRPDLAAYREELMMYKYLYYSSFSSYMPKVFAYANYSYSNRDNLSYSSSSSQINVDGNSFNYGMFATLNLFDGFQRYNKIKGLKDNLDSKYISASQKSLQLIQDINDAYISILSNNELLNNSKILMQILNEERDLVLKEYQVGEVNIVRLNLVQSQFIDSQLEHNQNMIALIKSYINLKFSCNIFDEF